MIIWTFFQTSEDIYRYKKCYLPNALRPTSFSYLDSYCELSLSLSQPQMKFRRSYKKKGCSIANLIFLCLPSVTVNVCYKYINRPCTCYVLALALRQVHGLDVLGKIVLIRGHQVEFYH